MGNLETSDGVGVGVFWGVSRFMYFKGWVAVTSHHTVIVIIVIDIAIVVVSLGYISRGFWGVGSGRGGVASFKWGGRTDTYILSHLI